MPSVSTEQITDARKMDLMSYMMVYEPHLLQKWGKEYRSREHHSLFIRSDGVWNWFSHGFGGRSALDYLVKVKEVPFVDAVRQLSGIQQIRIAIHQTGPEAFILPPKSEGTKAVRSYLEWRGINSDIIDMCIDQGILYQTMKKYEGKTYQNCAFIGKDMEGTPRYCFLRGIRGDFKQEIKNSIKRYSFKLDFPEVEPTKVFASESAIDSISYASMLYEKDRTTWKDTAYLSLGGLFANSLLQYLLDHPYCKQVIIGTDNDLWGNRGRDRLLELLAEKSIETTYQPAKRGKDYNRWLRMQRADERKQKSEMER